MTKPTRSKKASDGVPVSGGRITRQKTKTSTQNTIGMQYAVEKQPGFLSSGKWNAVQSFNSGSAEPIIIITCHNTFILAGSGLCENIRRGVLRASAIDNVKRSQVEVSLTRGGS